MDKTNLFWRGVVGLFLLFPTTSFAQSSEVIDLKKPQKGEDIMVIYNTGSHDSTIVNVFSKNTPKHFTAPGLPRFAIVGKQNKYYLGIGGYVKGTASFDFDGVINSPTNFTTNAIPVPKIPGNGAKFQASAATSNIFFNFVGLPNTENEFGAYINANFTGDNYAFTLLGAYVTYRGFLLGYSTSLFTDAAAVPPTIDYEGPSGLTFVYNTVLQYTYNINKKWSAAVAAEMPMLSATYRAPYTQDVYQRIPDIPVYLQYAWNNGASWLRASGLFRTLTYRDELAHKNRNEFGWGVKLSGAANILPNLKAFYQGVYGEGITNYIQDMTGLGMDMVYCANNNGHMSRVKSWGAYGGLQYNFSPTTFMSCTYSQDRAYMPDGIVDPSGYKYAQYLVANMFWNLVPNVQMGVEYLWGRRVNHDRESNHANRIQTMVQFNF